MKTIRRLIYGEVLASIALVALGFLALFFFFDLVDELRWVGRAGEDGYQLSHALLFVVLSIPSHLYELLPITVLIGTIFVMARLAQSSEFTIMRAASMSTRMAIGMLFKIGVVIVAVAFVFGELIVPRTSPLAEKVRLTAQGAAVSAEFRSGLWTRDIIK
eukprot:gene19203-23527_t